MLETLLASGLRASELCSLTNSQVNFDSCKFEKVVRKGRKVQDVYFPHQLQHWFRPYLLKRKELGIVSNKLFCYEDARPVNYSALKRFMQRLGINAHRLRHEFGSTVYEKTNDIVFTCNRLGHSDVKTTLGYIHREINTVTQKLDVVFKQ